MVYHSENLLAKQRILVNNNLNTRSNRHDGFWLKNEHLHLKIDDKNILLLSEASLNDRIMNAALVLHCVKNVEIRSFFWSVFSCTRTEYGDLLQKSRYSVRIQENTRKKKIRVWTLFTQC